MSNGAQPRPEGGSRLGQLFVAWAWASIECTRDKEAEAAAVQPRNLQGLASWKASHLSPRSEFDKLLLRA